MSVSLHAAILAGGMGMRFWPLSVPERPKQFLRLLGERTFLQATADRAAPLTGWDRIWVSTSAPLAEEAARQLPTLNPDRFVVEPTGRNTLPCIALTFGAARRCDPEAVAAALPSDHRIADAPAFRAVLSAAGEIAEHTGRAVLIGCQPTRPETGYGYIRFGGRAAEANGVEARQILQFTEKPDRETAEAFLSSGEYLWNCGMFVWKTDAFFDELWRRAPEIADPIEEALEKPDRLDALYRALPSVSIDKGLIEKMDGALVIPAEFGWDDIGSWASVWSALPQDSDGNAVQGQGAALDTRDCLIFSQNKPILTLGVDGLAVIETDEAVMVCPLDRSQDVRELARLFYSQTNND